MPKITGYTKAKMSNKSNSAIANEGTGPANVRKASNQKTPSSKPAKQ